MTPELTALLHGEPTQDTPFTVTGSHAVAYRDRTIALAVMRECAKLVCVFCDMGVGFEDPETQEGNEFVHIGENATCPAADILTAISEAEAAQ